MSYRCTAQDTQRELEVFALYPGNAGPKAVDREFFSHGRPLQRVTVDNDLFTTQDTMHVHIVYNEEGTVDFRRPVGDTHYLLIYSTPMNWVGRMVSEWRFVQLVAFDEGRIYELALPNEPA